MRDLLGIAVLICVVLAAVATLSKTGLQTDAASALGKDGAAAALLASRDGRQVTLALVGPDIDHRSQAAKSLAQTLAGDPRVRTVRTGLTADSAALDWLWAHRFRLDPPTAEDLTADAMADRFQEAKRTLTQIGGMAFGDRLLRDPTGSFARLVERLRHAGPQLPSHLGVWQAQNDRAAILLLELEVRPFTVRDIRVLTDEITARAEAAGVAAHLIGPQIIAAEVSQSVQRASALAVGLALLLLIGWLAWRLRSARRLGAVFLPLGIGLGAGVLAVAAAFGSVHAIALGFGGALTGLALDYPLHLASHPRSARRHAVRLIRLGALTTAATFLALLGSEIPALAQTGVFVATGLVVSALAASWLAGSDPAERPDAQERRRWSAKLDFPGRALAESAVAGLGLALLLTAQGTERQGLFALPAETQAKIDGMREMLPLPSGRYAVRIEGPDTETVLTRGEQLRPILDKATELGWLSAHTLSARFLPSLATQAAAKATLPATDELRGEVSRALELAGLAPRFAEAVLSSYGAALSAPLVSAEALAAQTALEPLTRGLTAAPTPAAERVSLTGLTRADMLASEIAAANIEGVRFVDQAADIAEELGRIRASVLQWFGVGAGAAFIVLAVGLQQARHALSIGRSTAAAIGLTVLLVVLISGPPSIFQIVALTLVVGIGVDYGLFLRSARSAEERNAARASVMLCATTTLIAFGVMAFSPIALLSEIGLTVSIGVVAMLGLHLTIPPERGA